MRRVTIILAVVTGVSLFLHNVDGTDAYTINTGFTHPCHEEMTLEGARRLLDAEDFDTKATIPLPAGDKMWKEALEYFTRGMTLGLADDREKFLFLSLIVGSRYPDNRGKSITNAKALREIHRDPEGQDSHFLRSAGDDWAEGDLSAIAAGINHIEQHTSMARSYLELPPGDQVTEVSLYFEFYGQVKIKIWAPAFHMGIAAHTVQDAFSHTVRSDDLHTIRHVCNYVDAVSNDWDLERDGLRHSWAMDRCEEEAVGIAEGARLATVDFMALLAQENQTEFDEGYQIFLEDWMGYQEGCNDANDYCDSIWADVARSDPTLPIWEDYFGCDCSQAPGHGTSGPAILLLLVAVLGIAPWPKSR